MNPWVPEDGRCVLCKAVLEPYKEEEGTNICDACEEEQLNPLGTEGEKK